MNVLITFRPLNRNQVRCTCCGWIGRGGRSSRSHRITCANQMREANGTLSRNRHLIRAAQGDAFRPAIAPPLSRQPEVRPRPRLAQNQVQGEFDIDSDTRFNCPKCHSDDWRDGRFSGNTYCRFCDHRFEVLAPSGSRFL